MPLPIPAAYYARTSTEEQKERQTIQSQVSALEAEITKQGDELVGRYVDDGCSGALLDRPALERLRADAREKRFRKLYIYSPDRLARELMLQLLVVKELRRRDIQLVFLSQKFGDSPSDRLLFQMLGAISEFERAQILERTRRGKLHKARAGLVIGSIAKFGYTYVRKTETTPARYEINPNEADTVREIFRLFSAPGVWGLRTLAAELHRLGFKNRSGNTKWAKSTLARVLTDSIYAGTWYYNKYTACEPLKAREDTWYHGNTSRKLRPKEEWIPIKVPAIITNSQLETAIGKLARNRELSERNAKYQYLLKGLIFCGCGRRMYGYPCHRIPRYKCADKWMSYPLPKTCRQPSLAADVLDRTIWHAFVYTLDQPEVVAAKLSKVNGDRQAERTAGDRKRIELKKALAVLAEQEKRLLEAYASNVINLTQLKAQLASITTRKDSLAQEMQRLAGEKPNSPMLISEDEIRRYFDKIKEKTLGATFELRREIIRLFADRLIVDGKRVCLKAFLPKSVAIASTDPVYPGRSMHHIFDVAFDLGHPEQISIQPPSNPFARQTSSD